MLSVPHWNFRFACAVISMMSDSAKLIAPDWSQDKTMSNQPSQTGLAGAAAARRDTSCEMAAVTLMGDLKNIYFWWNLWVNSWSHA